MWVKYIPYIHGSYMYVIFHLIMLGTFPAKKLHLASFFPIFQVRRIRRKAQLSRSGDDHRCPPLVCQNRFLEFTMGEQRQQQS